MSFKINPNWKRVRKDSSQIKEIVHNEKENRLFIVFHNNDVYSYSPFTAEEFKKFSNAESVGSYFYKNIRNNKSIKTTKVSNG